MKVILTDGTENFESREINDIAELEDLNRKAKEATDGNLYWVPEI
jgi:hypothetical protein